MRHLVFISSFLFKNISITYQNKYTYSAASALLHLFGIIQRKKRQNDPWFCLCRQQRLPSWNHRICQRLNTFVVFGISSSRKVLVEASNLLKHL